MPRNLLLADDSITIQKVVGITFAGEDYTIVAVDNGEDAVRKAKEIRPDVILADVVMPKKNGYEVCEEIKADPALKHIPVLLLAGTFEAFDDSRARAARADGHIAKPFDSQALINKVRELLERTVPGVASSAPSILPTTVPPAPPAPAAPAPPTLRPVSSAAPGSRLTPPVLTRHATPPAPPPTAPAPAAVPPGSPPSPILTDASSDESFEDFWTRNEAPGRSAAPALPARPSEPAAAPVPASVQERTAAGDLDWAALGLETDVAAAQPPPAPPSVAETAQAVSMPAAVDGMLPDAPEAARGPEHPAQESRTTVAASSVQPPELLPFGEPIDLADLEVEDAMVEDAVIEVEAILTDPEPAPSAPPPTVDEAPAGRTGSLDGDRGGGLGLPDAAGHLESSSEAPPARPNGDGGEALLREALSQASREVIERIAWEVIPTLAETIIREHVERLVKQREK